MEYNKAANKVDNAQTNAQVNQEQPQIRQVCDGSQVVGKEKNKVKEAVKDTAGYILKDILVPALKKTVVNMVSSGINMLVNGGNYQQPGNNYGTNYVTNYTSFSRTPSWNNYGYQPNSSQMCDLSQSRGQYSVKDYYVPNMGVAAQVRDILQEACETRGRVSVKDYLYCIGKQSDVTYMDTSWGWYNLSDIRLIPCGDAVLIAMPPVSPMR